MTAESPKRYLFDNDFGHDVGLHTRAPHGGTPTPETAVDPDTAISDADAVEAEVVEEAPPPPSYTQEDLDRAREEGLNAGRDAAARDMASAIEQRLLDTLDAINNQVAGLFNAYQEDKEQHSRDAVAVATVIVRKLFPAMNMDKAMAEIEHMIIEAMKRTSGSPALIIRVPEDIHTEVEDKAKDLAALRGREGTLNIIADKDMALGDVMVEWDGGGMSRNTALIWQEIDEIIERNLGQSTKPDGEHTEPTAARATETSPKPSQPGVEQEVVNTAQVGENEDYSAESEHSETMPAKEHEPQDAPHTAPNDAQED